MNTIGQIGKVLLDEAFSLLPVKDASSGIGDRAHVVEREMRHTILKHSRNDGRREDLAMSHDGVTHALDFLYRHVGIGCQCQVIRLEALVDKAVDGGMHLVAHRLDNHAVDGIVVTFTSELERLETRYVALLCLFAHRQQLIGETTHSRNYHNYRLSFGIDYIPKVEQTLDRSDRGTAKFHHFHCYQTIVFTYIT